MVLEIRHVGTAGAAAIRNRSMMVRLGLMGVIALLLWRPGNWAFAGLWWAVYAALQVATAYANHRRPAWGMRPLYLLSFVSFCVAGFPTWHLWTHVGVLGVAAASLFLSGMLAQLVTSSLAARKLFWTSAAPLVGYLVLVPILAADPARMTESLAVSVCGLALVGYLAVLWNGQRQALEDVEQSRANAEAASRAKTEFLATMSHEIRTPMNAVLGAADLLDRTELSEEQREHVTMLRDAGQMLMQILNDVLDLAKIEAGKLVIERSDTDLHAFVHRCAAFWRPRVQDAGLELKVDIDPATPQFVVIDAIRTGQILFNLISNAVKFTAKGSITLAVSAKPLETGGYEIELSVTDTGMGMSKETVARLFTAFEQADGSITRKFGGTGLGLSIGQKLASMMGGAIATRSAEGVGSIFCLTLPAALGVGTAAEVEAAASGEVLDPGGASLRLLVAEDNAANQRIIELFLRPLGAEVTMVSDGLQAVEMLSVAPFDVVLMDMQMPVMGGLEATRLVRASGGPNADAPILALTANVMDAHRQACADAGMNGHIAKPIDSRLLLTSVLNAARGVTPGWPGLDDADEGEDEAQAIAS